MQIRKEKTLHLIMGGKRSGTGDVEIEFPQPPTKRKRSGGRSLGQIDIPDHINTFRQKGNVANAEHGRHSHEDIRDKSIIIASAANFADQTVAPFLTKHIPQQYAPLGGPLSNQKQPPKDPNSKYCYRHRPDRLCRRQANEPSMDQLQKVRRPCTDWSEKKAKWMKGPRHTLTG